MTSFTDQKNIFYLSGFKSNMILNPTYIYFAYGESPVAPDIKNNSITQSTITRSILGGKRIKAENMFYMIKRVDWVSGTVYDAYSDEDVMEGKNFYVLASNRVVYKCISNNNGGPSTTEPSIIGGPTFKTSDGYVWKYMYRLTTDDLQNTVLPDLMPIREDTYSTDITPGTIDVIDVRFGGSQYFEYNGNVLQNLSGNRIRIPSDAPALDGIFNDSSLYVTSGTGAGSISRITNYSSNSSGRYITLEDPLSLDITSNFNISPTITIDGDGRNFKARSVVTDGTITSVEVIDNGEFYTYGDVVISANTFYGSGAYLKPVISPLYGHSAQIPSELKSRHLTVFLEIDGDEGETIPGDVNFCVYGILNGIYDANNPTQLYSEPTFDATALMEVTYFNGEMHIGDKIVTQGTSNKRGTVVSANTSHVRITYDNRDFFEVGENIVNQTGVTAAITDIKQPDILTHSAVLLTGDSISMFKRYPDETERFVVTLSI